MKKYTRMTTAAAIAEIQDKFKQSIILRVWEDKNSIDILFEVEGEEVELISSNDSYFTNVAPYLLIY